MKHYGNRAGDEDTFSKWATNKQKHSITRQVNAHYQRLAHNRFYMVLSNTMNKPLKR